MKILETQRDPCHQTCPSKYLSIFQCQPAFSWKIIAHNYTAYTQLYSSGHFGNLDILTFLQFQTEDCRVRSAYTRARQGLHLPGIKV